MAINLKFPLKRSSKGAFATNDTTIEAITDDIRILLMSNYGERPIHYDFGANLRSIIFDQGPSVLQKAEDLIIAAIEKWLPFVKIRSIAVNDASTDSTLRPNELNIDLEFEVGQIVGSLKQRIRN